MKCPYCNYNHPDDYEFCPKTGRKIELIACINDKCSEFGKHILPLDACFCPVCGHSLTSSSFRAIIVLDYNTKVVDGKDEIVLSVLSPMGTELYHHNNLLRADDIVVASDAVYICTEAECSDNIDVPWLKVDSYGKVSNARCDDIPVTEVINDDTSWQSSIRNKLFLRRNPTIRETMYIGKIKGKSVFVALADNQFYLATNPNHYLCDYEDENVVGAKVYDEDFNVLFTIDGHYTPKWAFNPGFFSIKDTNTGKYGLCDLEHNIVIPCQYDSSVYGEYDHIIEVPEDSGFGYNRCYCTLNSLWYSGSYERYLLERISDERVKVVNPKTGNVICEVDPGYLAPYGGNPFVREFDGFTQFNYCPNLLSRGDTIIKLDAAIDKKDRYECCYSRDDSCPYHEGVSHDDCLTFFISEERIITCVKEWNGSDIYRILIRDYSGKVVKEFDSSTTFKRPFKNGKAVFVKTTAYDRRVGFVDKDGGIHLLPLSLSLEEDLSGEEIELSDIDCEFVSEDTIWVNNNCNYYLISTDGTILLEDVRIDIISFNLLKVYNYDNNQETLCDGHGKTIYPLNSSYNNHFNLIKFIR